MLRLLLRFWVVFVVAISATLPVTGVTAWAGQGCEGCPCDTAVLGEEGPEEHEEPGDTCPPECASCHCALQAAVVLCEPGWVQAPGVQSQMLYQDPPEILIPGEPRPIFTPPKQA
jgi:hypothetical protein